MRGQRGYPREQHAEAEMAVEPDGDQADGEVGAAVARMHAMWEQAHLARTELIETRAQGFSAAHQTRRAEAAAERAMAAEAEVEAAEHRAQAHGDEQESQPAGDTDRAAISAAAPAPQELLDREIQAISRLLAERGPIPAAEIARLVGARYWGPGVFRRALAESVAGGMVRRVGHDIYRMADHDDDQG